MNIIVKNDIKEFLENFKYIDKFKNKTFLITGITGLIGSSLANYLLAMEKNIFIIAPVRNLYKASEKFSHTSLSKISLIDCPDIIDFNYNELPDVDYIIHCAAPTSSKYFVDYPVETFRIIVEGTRQILDFAKNYTKSKVVYLSSLEVYGDVLDDSKEIDETMQGYINPMSVRSSYPIAKRSAENLCCLYAAEYNVNVSIARLTQTTGAGLSADDHRIIADLARCAALKKDIVLHTTGESARQYCYINDAISGILTLCLFGKSGGAYNIANENTYISAKDMAELLHIRYGIPVRYELNENMGYAPPSKLKLSTNKLKDLGWMPQYDLLKIFEKLIESIKCGM